MSHHLFSICSNFISLIIPGSGPEQLGLPSDSQSSIFGSWDSEIHPTLLQDSHLPVRPLCHGTGRYSFFCFSLFLSFLLVGEVPWWLLMAPPKGRVDLSRTCTQPPAVHRLISACYLRTGWYYSLPGCCHCNGDPCPKPTCHSLKYLPVFWGIWNTESVSLMVPVSNGLQLVQ